MVKLVEIVDNDTKLEYLVSYEIVDNAVYIYRMAGKNSEVYVPDRIDDLKVIEIYKYCFSRKNVLSQDMNEEFIQKLEEYPDFCELSSDNVSFVKLPENIKNIGDYAFYNCKQLECLEFGNNIENVGCGAFMNCNKLSKMIILADIKDSTPLFLMLGKVKREIIIYFNTQGEIKAGFYFPEYEENYDEIAPAHIFAISYEGEGYKARQCFFDGMFNVLEYDKTFFNAKSTQKAEDLYKMPLLRLQYKVELSEGFEQLYKNYILENATEILNKIVEKKSIKELETIVALNLLKREQLLPAIISCQKKGWITGTSILVKGCQNNN